MNSKIISALIFIFLSSNSLFAQQYKWVTLPNSPVGNSRFSDCSFINPSTGWICGESTRNIHKTTDGGNTWVIVGQTPIGNRSIVFTDSLRGWTGEYNSSNRICKTTNGGISWEVINLPVMNIGTCGFSMVSDSVIYGCGRYWGPARIIKTTNAGANWQVIDMSSYALGLVDCKFFTPDSGFVVGRAQIGSVRRGIVLFTSDGGASWDTSHFTQSTADQWCWKINFTTHNVAYVSLEAASSSPHYFLKTTNRGVTWQEKIYSNSIEYDAEGIGFINENTGWIGGWSTFTFETTNGGDNWHVLDTIGTGGHARNINRYRFFGDTLGYAVGYRVYKYTKDIITHLNPNQNFIVKDFKLYQNFPNPFNPTTKIKFNLPVGTNVRITIHDILGKEIATMVEGDFLSAGDWEFEWDATDFPSGVYYYTVYNNDIGHTKSMMLVK